MEDDTQLDVEIEMAEVDLNADSAPAGEPKKKRERREPQSLTREPGRSLFPHSRVQKIIKADKEIPIIAKDATFLVSLATEEFIRLLCEAGQRVAEKEKRLTVQHKDIATVVRKADEFLFLDEIVQLAAPGAQAKRKPKAMTSLTSAPTMLDQFVGTKEKGKERSNQDDTMEGVEEEQEEEEL